MAEQLINSTTSAINPANLLSAATITPDWTKGTQLQKDTKSDLYSQKIIQELRKSARYLNDITLDICDENDRLVYQDGLIWILDNEELRTIIVNYCHDDALARQLV